MLPSLSVRQAVPVPKAAGCFKFRIAVSCRSRHAMPLQLQVFHHRTLCFCLLKLSTLNAIKIRETVIIVSRERKHPAGASSRVDMSLNVICLTCILRRGNQLLLFPQPIEKSEVRAETDFVSAKPRERSRFSPVLVSSFLPSSLLPSDQLLCFCLLEMEGYAFCSGLEQQICAGTCLILDQRENGYV